MRVSLILGVCIVLCGAVVAQASPLPCTGTGDIQKGDFTYTRTPVTIYGTSLDELQIYFTTAPTAAAGDNLQILEGTWTALTGGIWSDPLPLNPSFQADTNNSITNVGKSHENYATEYGLSYVNFDTSNGSAYWALGTQLATNSGAGTGSYAYLEGSWYASTPSTGSLPAGSLAAMVFVTPGANATFTGSWGAPVSGGGSGLTPGGFGFSNSVTCVGTFSTTVPEPSTLFLAAGGLVGLLCYAWRKRR